MSQVLYTLRHCKFKSMNLQTEVLLVLGIICTCIEISNNFLNSQGLVFKLFQNNIPYYIKK